MEMSHLRGLAALRGAWGCPSYKGFLGWEWR